MLDIFFLFYFLLICVQLRHGCRVSDVSPAMRYCAVDTPPYIGTPLVRYANRPLGHKSRIRNVSQFFVRLLNSRTLTDLFNYDLYLHQVFFRISFSFVTCLSTFRRENKSCVTTQRKCSCKLAMITSVLGCAHTNTN